MVSRLLPIHFTPPTDEEKRYIEAFRSSLRNLLHAQDPRIVGAGARWQEYCKRLLELALRSDPRDFLTWDVIRTTMFVGNENYVIDELNFLKRSPQWKERWRRAIVEVPVGRPRRFLLYPQSSGNLIHQAYHIARFEQEMSYRVEDAKYVLEFGGGYGSMCRLLFTLGFSGKYVLLDLPPFSELQKLYLRLSGIRVASTDSVHTEWAQVLCIKDMEDLESTVRKYFHQDAVFIATRSLSESPFGVRCQVVNLFEKFAGILIAYQNQFEDIDNNAYFQELMARKASFQWRHIPIQHWAGHGDHYYLFGRAKECIG
jgi:hypothetical protein